MRPRGSCNVPLTRRSTFLPIPSLPSILKPFDRHPDFELPQFNCCDEFLNAPMTSVISGVTPPSQGLQSRRKPVSRGLVRLSDEDIRLLSALARRMHDSLD